MVFHSKDLALIKQIQSFFNGIGEIYPISDSKIFYIVNSIEDLSKYIIPHFDKYTLYTQQRVNFLGFREIVYLMSRGEHLTSEGFIYILSLFADIPKDLKKAYPDLVPIKWGFYVPDDIEDPHWIAGFVDRWPCFSVNKIKSKTCKSGYRVGLKFSILSPTTLEVGLFYLLRRYFLDCGKVKLNYRGSSKFVIGNFCDIKSHIIPFFSKYTLHSVNNIGFLNFCKVSTIIDSKSHLTEEGLKQIDKIRSDMRKGIFTPMSKF